MQRGLAGSPRCDGRGRGAGSYGICHHRLMLMVLEFLISLEFRAQFIYSLFLLLLPALAAFAEKNGDLGHHPPKCLVAAREMA